MLANDLHNRKRAKPDLKIRDEGKGTHCHSQQIKLNNFSVSLWTRELRFLVQSEIFVDN